VPLPWPPDVLGQPSRRSPASRSLTPRRGHDPQGKTIAPRYIISAVADWPSAASPFFVRNRGSDAILGCSLRRLRDAHRSRPLARIIHRGAMGSGDAGGRDTTFRGVRDAVIEV
jgi:hypothetical protein